MTDQAQPVDDAEIAAIYGRIKHSYHNEGKGVVVADADTLYRYWLGERQKVAELEARQAADDKEIGSYREGTGLRGEWKELQAKVAELEAVLRDAPDPRQGYPNYQTIDYINFYDRIQKALNNE